MASLNPLKAIRSLFYRENKAKNVAGVLNSVPLPPTTQVDPSNVLGMGRFQEAGPLLGIINTATAGRKLRTDWNSKRAYNEAFEASCYVYSCISLWCSSVSTIPWIVRKRQEDDTWKRVPNHKVEKFLKNPNSLQSGVELFSRTTLDLFVSGNSLWKKVYVNNGKTLKEIWPLDVDLIKPIPDKVNFVPGYMITDNGKDIPIDTKLICHHMLISNNLWWGLSPLKAIAQEVDCDAEIMNWFINQLVTGCRKDGVISFNHDLTEDEYNLTVNQVRTQLVNSIGGSFPLILGHEANWVQLSNDPSEMNFIESQKILKENVAAALRVPAPLAGINDHSTYNNVETATKIFYIGAVIPFLERLKGTLNRCILPDFIKEGDLDNWEIDFDVSKVEFLADDFSKKLEQAQILYGMGVPFNQISRRVELDIEDIEGGDLGYILENYVPLEQPQQAMKQAAESHKAEMAQAKVKLETSKNPPVAPVGPPMEGGKAPMGKSPVTPSKPPLADNPPSAGSKLPNQMPKKP